MLIYLKWKVLIDNLVCVNEVLDILIKFVSNSFTLCAVLILCLPVVLSNVVEGVSATGKGIGTR